MQNFAVIIFAVSCLGQAIAGGHGTVTPSTQQVQTQQVHLAQYVEITLEGNSDVTVAQNYLQSAPLTYKEQTCTFKKFHHVYQLNGGSVTNYDITYDANCAAPISNINVASVCWATFLVFQNNQPQGQYVFGLGECSVAI